MNAIENRILRLTSHLGLSSTTDAFNFFDQLKKSELPSSAQAQLLLLAFNGIYPSKDAVISLETRLNGDRFETIHEELLKSSQQRGRDINTPAWVMADPKGIYVDVTHTVQYPYNSGIQRVVRKLCERFHLYKDQKIHFFVYDEALKGPRPVNAEELQRITQFGAPISENSRQKLSWLLQRVIKAGPRQFVGYFYSDIKWLALIWYHRLRSDFLIPLSTRFKFAGHCLKAIDDLKIKVKKSLFHLRTEKRMRTQEAALNNSEILILLNSNILIPELVIEDSRINFYLDLKTQKLPNQLGVICYDLIPLIAPEFCSVTGTFIEYLRLFRVADKISCISHTVVDDVKNFLRIIDRKESLVTVESHYLGADFARSQDHPKPINDSLIFDQEIPIVACVGTFEPRKNQVNIVRAAYLLYKKGVRFRLVFAGNPGWRNDLFEMERTTLDPQEQFISVRTRVSDAFLLHLYQKAKFAVFCSHEEGFGLPIVEASIYGKPVVTSNKSSMKEMAAWVGGCLLVDPDNISEMASAMEKLLTDPALYQSKVREIRNVDSLTWDTYAKNITQFFV